ncbi:hypothetical protein ACVJ5M_005756 [Bradyrhizobium sp. S3.7.6]
MNGDTTPFIYQLEEKLYWRARRLSKPGVTVRSFKKVK